MHARLDRVETDVHELDTDVRALRETVSELRGGLKVAAWALPLATSILTSGLLLGLLKLFLAKGTP